MMKPADSQYTDITAVLVTYNIGASVCESLDALLPQVGMCVVIDNGSTDDTVELLERYCFEQGVMDRLILLHNSENNLAMAQNMGIRYAQQHGTVWVLLMDHDSVPASDMVASLLHVYRYDPKAPTTGMLIPNRTDRHSVREARFVCHYGRILPSRVGLGRHSSMDHVMLAIASGSLIPMHMIDQIGMMDEALGIDNVDFDFSLRVLNAGYRIVAVRDAWMHHQLGECRDHIVAGKRITTSNHSARRRYTIYRNRLILWRRYAIAFPAYTMIDLCAVIYDLGKILWFEECKRAKYQAIMRGVKDALVGQSKY